MGEASKPGPLVVVIHGALRSRVGLMPVVWALRKRGLDAHAFGYATRRDSLARHAERLEAAIDDLRMKRGEQQALPLLGLFTHSMGGLVARAYLARPGAREQSKRQRLWMLAPPNQGAYVADKLRDWKTFRWLYGAAAESLLPERAGEVGNLPKTAEARVLAGGDLEGEKGLHRWIPGNHDGLVRVEETALPGVEPKLVGGSHSTLQWRGDLLAEAASFFLAPLLDGTN